MKQLDCTEKCQFTAMFYQAVATALLLYGSESWVLPSSALKVLEGFPVEVGQWLMDMHLQRWTVRVWIYPKPIKFIAVARLWPVAIYIRRCRHHIAKIIEGRTLLEECMGGGEAE